MVLHTTRRRDLSSTQPRRVGWTGRLIWLLVLLAAAAVAAVAGIVVGEQLTRSPAGAPATHREPKADNREVPGKTADRASSSVASQARPRPGQEYLWRPAYVRGKVVLIRVRPDAANVREDREISR